MRANQARGSTEDRADVEPTVKIRTTTGDEENEANEAGGFKDSEDSGHGWFLESAAGEIGFIRKTACARHSERISI